MNTKTFYEKWQQYQYYVIIGVVSFLALFFFPMIGSSVGLAWTLPTTAAGWVVYTITKLCVAALNLLIFHCFVLQAKVNSKDHPNYIEALTILNKLENPDGEAAPSPKQYFAGVYGKKGITVFVSTLLAAIGLTQAVLVFDFATLLTYLFTILLGIIFGILQMNQTEIYWQEVYLRYAKETERKALTITAIHEEVVEGDGVSVASPQHILSGNDTAGPFRRADLLVSPDNNSPDGNTN